MSETQSKDLVKEVTSSDIKLGPKGLQVENMAQLATMLKLVIHSGLAPTGCKSLSDAIIRTQHGMSVGLDPMRALQSVYVVNGRPCLWGAAVPGIILSSGKCKLWKVEVLREGENMLARVTTERSDVAGENVFEFSMKDAILAGLPNKNATWKAYPKDHLRHKAVARAATSLYGDLMSGLAVVEDMQDAIDVDATVEAPATVASTLDAMADELDAQAPPEEVVAEVVEEPGQEELFSEVAEKQTFKDKG